MTDSLASRLAARFADDAHALRARASVLAARSPKERGGGPDAAACRAMADACDRVSTLFAGVGDAPLADALATLERYRADERVPDAGHVYAGAIARLRQALAPDGDADDDDPDDDLDDEDDDTEDEG